MDIIIWTSIALQLLFSSNLPAFSLMASRVFIKTEQIPSKLPNCKVLRSFGLLIFSKDKAKRRRNAVAFRGVLTKYLGKRSDQNLLQFKLLYPTTAGFACNCKGFFATVSEANNCEQGEQLTNRHLLRKYLFVEEEPWNYTDYKKWHYLIFPAGWRAPFFWAGVIFAARFAIILNSLTVRHSR